jgi:hypothetical protein
MICCFSLLVRTNRNPSHHFVVFVSIHVASMVSTPWFACSTEPCDSLCLGLLWIIFISFHISHKLFMIWLQNSLPLWEWRMFGAPELVKISRRWYATSSALLLCRDRRTNFVRWSWYTKINYISRSGLNCISIRQTWHWEFILLCRIGSTTSHFYRVLCFFLAWLT